MTVILYVAVSVVSLLIIGLVLVQQSKGGGLGGAFGGGGDSVFGAQAGNHLTKLTVILTTVFFVLVLLLAVLSGMSGEEALVVTEDAPAELPNVEAPVVDAAEVNAEVEKKTEEVAGAVKAVVESVDAVKPVEGEAVTK